MILSSKSTFKQGSTGTSNEIVPLQGKTLDLRLMSMKTKMHVYMKLKKPITLTVTMSRPLQMRPKSKDSIIPKVSFQE